MPRIYERQETKVPSDPIDYGYEDATQEVLGQLDRYTRSDSPITDEEERHLGIEEVQILLHGHIQDSRSLRGGQYE